MLGLKDINEVIEYNYRVCEVFGCDEEATEFLERDLRSIDVCLVHYIEIQRNYYTY